MRRGDPRERKKSFLSHGSKGPIIKTKPRHQGVLFVFFRKQPRNSTMEIKRFAHTTTKSLFPCFSGEKTKRGKRKSNKNRKKRGGRVPREGVHDSFSSFRSVSVSQSYRILVLPLFLLLISLCLRFSFQVFSFSSMASPFFFFSLELPRIL